ncbi:MAG: TerC family protein [Deinococcales bacterium]
MVAEAGGFSWDGLLKIIIADIVLSGDNAVVIGLAVATLPLALRKQAILLGTVGAIGLRIIFTLIGAVLLGIPLLGALGGLTLLWVGWKLLAQEESHEESASPSGSYWDAIRTIIIADAVMSLDNALAVAGAAHGDFFLLMLGLGLSIPLLMVGSNAVSGLFNRYPWLVYIGAGLIAWVAADLIHEDKFLHNVLPVLHSEPSLWVMRLLAVAGVLFFGLRSKQLRADAVSAKSA